MGKIDIKQSIEVNTNAAKAWELIGPNFVNIAEWGPGINKSWKNDSLPSKFENAPAGGRFCDVNGFGKMDERIIHYDSSKHEISWSAEGEKIPGFVSGLQNQLKVEAIGDTTCKVSTNITANTSGIMGALMGGMMKKNLAKLINRFLNDWKTYAETGEVSEHKKRQMAKFAQKA